MAVNNQKYLRRRRFLASLGVGVAVGAAGCLGDEDEGTTDDDSDGPSGPSGSYDTASGSSFTTLNPIYNTEAGAGVAIDRALNPGYTFTPEDELFPLVYDVRAEDDAQVWVFEVRDGLEFSDPYGKVTAESFVYQIQELHQAEWAATANAQDWAGVEVHETGELEFQAELPHPDPLWPESFDPLEYPIPIDLVEPYVQDEDIQGLQEDEELLELQFTGNLGPYILEEWERGAGTTYTRNDDYYLQKIDDGPERFANAPYFEEASIQVIEEEASRLGALETGEIDNAEIPPARVDEFENKGEVDVYSIEQPYNRILAVNMRDNGWNAGPGNLFRETAFRQAMACAINKQELIEGVYRGRAEPHFTWQPRWSRWYPDTEELPNYGVDDMYGRDVARQKVEQALQQVDEEYRYEGDDFVTPDGDQVVLDLYWTDISAVNELLAEFIRQELEENLGIKVNLQPIDGTRFTEEYWQASPEGGTATIDGEEVEWAEPTPQNPGPREVTANEDWDMSIVFGLNTYPLYPLTNEIFFDGPTSFFNPVGYYPEFDAAGVWEAARAATNEDELQAPFEEFFINVAKEQPYIMLVFDDSNQGYVAGLEGPIEDFHNGWDFPAWYFPE